MTNTLAITTLILVIILVVPIVCKKIHLPAIVGLILSGIVIGPLGFDLVGRTETIDVFGQLGILYIMFLSGIEIDMDSFRQSRSRSIVFGALSFFLPLLAGVGGGLLLGMNPWSALLVASILGSHTLMTYPVVSRFGIQKNEAVNLVIGCTIFCVTGAMLILAGVSSRFHEQLSWLYGLRLVVGSAAMLGSIFWAMPRLARWFFHRFNDAVLEFLFVMVLVAIAGLLARAAGLEPILGVFLCGLALNRQIPNLSPLMNRIQFVGNGIFIPVFLVGVGMLIDVHVLAYGYGTIKMITLMVTAGISMKWVAAWIAQKTMRLNDPQRRLMFGLTNAHAAGALATVMIGYAITMPDGTPLLSEQVMNATIILILVACTVSSFLTEHAARQLSQELTPDEHLTADEMQLLIPVSNPLTNRRLVELATVLISRHPESAIHATTVSATPEQQARAERLLDDTARLAAATDHPLLLHRQLAVNVPNGIRAVASARSITHIVLGLPESPEEQVVAKEPTGKTAAKGKGASKASAAAKGKSSSKASAGYGSVAEPLIPLAGQQLWLYHSAQSLHSIRQVRVLVPLHAENEPDYTGWQILIERLVQTLGAEVTQETVTDWTFLPRAAKRMAPDELYIIVQARRSTPSYSVDMEHVADTMRTCFADRDYIILFPAQHVESGPENAFLTESARGGESTYSFIQRIVENRRKK